MEISILPEGAQIQVSSAPVLSMIVNIVSSSKFDYGSDPDCADDEYHDNSAKTNCKLLSRLEVQPAASVVFSHDEERTFRARCSASLKSNKYCVTCRFVFLLLNP